jgi:mono/diheme cytochrome c family protein
MAKNMGTGSLASSAVQGQSDAQLKGAILKGKGKMPAQKITDAQASDVVKFIRSLK